MDKLVISVMVKNEENNIIDTLEPFVIFGLKNFHIYDTGSTDDTVSKLKEYFSNRELNGIISEGSFVNFAVSRNKCIELAKEFFPGLFILMIDSEWYAKGIEELIKHINKLSELNGKFDYCNITLKSGYVFKHSRLFFPGTNAIFVGAVHEYIQGVSSNLNVPNTFYMEYKPKKSSKERWYRDLSILTKEYDERKNPRDVFYLGQTYDCLNMVELAVKYYLERGKMKNGFIEEQYMAMYRAGKLTGFMS